MLQINRLVLYADNNLYSSVTHKHMLKMNQNLIKLAALLNDQQYHDGTSIGESLHISRAAVCKIVKKLTDYGIKITSTKGKGYRLEEPLILLDPKKIKSQLHNKSTKLDVFEKVTSSNDYLRKLSHSSKFSICIAETQTEGKGRFNRDWHSPFGQNIYLSLACPLQKDITELSGLSLITGLALSEAIESCCQLPEKISLKWPNDLMIGEKKLGGILIEIQAEAHGSCNVLIGAGINVNLLQANKKQISKQWTSIRHTSGQYQDRNILCATMIEHILAYLERFKTSSFTDFQKEWKKRDALLNQALVVMSNKEKTSGIGAGINTHGQLVISLNNGMKKTFASGDTTLLK